MLDGVKWCDLHVFRPVRVRVCPVACLVDGEKMQDDDQREEREESPHGTKTSASSASSSSSSSLSSSIPPPSPAAAATSVPKEISEQKKAPAKNSQTKKGQRSTNNITGKFGVTRNGKRYLARKERLGTYDTSKEAAAAYDKLTYDLNRKPPVWNTYA